MYSPRRSFIRGTLALLGVALLFYRYFILEDIGVSERTVWVVDTSLSMLVEDIISSGSIGRQSRLDLAKKYIEEGIRVIPGEHALISYARDASVEVPLTSDITYLGARAAKLEGVEYYGGSNLEGALELVGLLYGGSPLPTRVILLSDGGSEGKIISLPKSNLSLSIIGIGSRAGGKIPLGYDADGNPRYKYFEGEEVIVPYDSSILSDLRDRAHAGMIETDRETPFPTELISSPPTESRKRLILLLATLLIVSSLLIHPYVSKR